MATMAMAPPMQAASAQKRTSSTAGLTASGRAVKRRASKACQCCRSRKVRCDVVESGIPCTNCRLDEVECCVTEGKRRKKSCIESDLMQHSPSNSAEERDEITQFPMFDDIDGLQDLSAPLRGPLSPGITNGLEQEISQHQPHMLYQNQSHKLTPEERSRRLSILTARGIPVQNPAVLASPSFPAFQLTNKVILPQYVPAMPNGILAEDMEYLQKKGAFLIPETGLRNELLRCYVQYVHPFLPLLDLEQFLGAIQKDDGTVQISLLLFQAAMFAGTAYIDMRYLTAQGYDTRKAARKAFFLRAKLLYDFDYEIDRVAVVQSVLLMTYWYESPEDPKDVWHWLGVAISLGRTIGLNCNTAASPLSVEKQKLWKRIWWCCYLRDRLVAIGMRRPIRIGEDEFDVPMLEVSDFETQPLPADLIRMIGGCSATRDTSKREMLAQMCIGMVHCCQLITRVLSAQYSMLGHRLGATQETTMRLVPRRSAANPEEVMKLDKDLETWYDSLPEELRYFKKTTIVSSTPDPISPNPPQSQREPNNLHDGDVLTLHRSLLTGLYLTTTSALHRPQMMPATPPHVHSLIPQSLKTLSKHRVRDAASSITLIFRDLYTRDLIRYLPNTGVSILLPAIIVHLLDIKSPDSATRVLSIRRFQFCMRCLQCLRGIYASADFAFEFLEEAIRKAGVSVGDEHKETQKDKQGSGHGQKRAHSQSVSGSRQARPQQNLAHHRSMSMIDTHNKQATRLYTTNLTPPPENPFTSNLERLRRASASASLSPASTADSTCINPQHTTLSPIDFTQNNPFFASFSHGQALTPPSSDKFGTLNEYTMTGGAAVSLVDMADMHHSPNSSIHDDSMGIISHGHTHGHIHADFASSASGYVEADKLIHMDVVDEEAMKNDFDQLINLEGGNVSMEQFLGDTLAGQSVTGGAGESSGDFWGGMSMPVLDEDDEQGRKEMDPAVRDLAAASVEARELRARILGEVEVENEAECESKDDLKMADADTDTITLRE